MKSQLQELIKKVFSDEKAKAEFLANPESAMKGFKLSRTEKKALLKTHSRLGMITSDNSHLEAAVYPETDWT